MVKGAPCFWGHFPDLKDSRGWIMVFWNSEEALSWSPGESLCHWGKNVLMTVEAK